MSMFDVPDHVAKPTQEIIPEGRYTGVLYLVVDCGSRLDTYQGDSRVKHEIYVAWELPETKMADGRPFVIGNHYSITDGKFGPYFAKTSNMNKLLRGWLGQDEKACSKPNLLGKLIKDATPCTITVGEQQGKKDPSKTYNIIEKVAPFKGKNPPQRVNEPLTYGPVGSPFPDSMPEWLKSRINSSLELTTGVPKREDRVHSDADDSDVPF